MQAALALTAQGKLSSYFITPRRLLQLLIAIQPNLKQNARSLTHLKSDEIYMYYSLASVQIATVRQVVRIFVSIPLRDHNKWFTLYKTQPLPVQLCNHSSAVSIKPDKQYLAVTLDNQYFMELDVEDVLACRVGVITVCPPMQPIYKPEGMSCLFALYVGVVITWRRRCATRK